jgi:hypothetical protein
MQPVAPACALAADSARSPPSGIESSFEEMLEPALDVTQAPPDNIEDIAARCLAAAPRYGIVLIEHSEVAAPRQRATNDRMAPRHRTTTSRA